MRAAENLGRFNNSTGGGAAPGGTSGFGYAGEYTDAETGFTYLRARYYDPATAQFLTRDPLEAITTDPYNYAANNPTTLTDPTGLFPGQGLLKAGRDWLLHGACLLEDFLDVVSCVAKELNPADLTGRAGHLISTGGLIGSAGVGAFAYAAKTGVSVGLATAVGTPLLAVGTVAIGFGIFQVARNCG
jgi:RHS repeat-associated protein